jgi:hypothetical protein
MRLLLFIFFSLISTKYIQAQKAISEATIKYIIAKQSNSADNSSKGIQQGTMTIYVKGDLCKTELQNNLGTEISYYDAKKKEGVILKEYSGQKLMIQLSEQNWKQHNQLFHNLSFTFDGTNKSINQVNCKKAMAKGADGQTITVYFSDEKDITNKDYPIAFPMLTGIPFEINKNIGNSNFQYALQSINYETVPSATFDILKSGYRVLSYDEAMKIKNH